MEAQNKNSNSGSENSADLSGAKNLGDFNSGRWTDEEHEKFLEALKLYGKNWNLVHTHVKTRSSA